MSTGVFTASSQVLQRYARQLHISTDSARSTFTLPPYSFTSFTFTEKTEATDSHSSRLRTSGTSSMTLTTASPPTPPSWLTLSSEYTNYAAFDDNTDTETMKPITNILPLTSETAHPPVVRTAQPLSFTRSAFTSLTLQPRSATQTAVTSRIEGY